jgi:hypothetical protein
MPVKYFEHQGVLIDVQSLLASRFKRWVARMDVNEIKQYHQEVDKPDDVTGNVVLIGGLGVVDGFRTLDQRQKGLIDVVIFELRNAERFIYHEMGPNEKDEAGRFKPHTPFGMLKNRVDFEGYDGHVK